MAAFTWDSAGVLQEIQKVSTLPEGWTGPTLEVANAIRVQFTPAIA